MTKDYPGEQWKTVEFNFEFTNDCRIEVSNFGRIRTFNVVSDGNILKGSMINGYRIIRLKLYRPREQKIQDKFDYLQQQVFKLKEELKTLKEENVDTQKIGETFELYETLKKKLSKKFADDLKKRTIHYQSLVHRLVAEYFLKPPAPADKSTVVAHLDYDKLNNRAGNLKWMTPDENYKHQLGSPYVIKEKQERYTRQKNSKTTKLTVTKVMLMKKLLNQGKPIKQLVKLFKVTDTQIYRIKRGENWRDIQPAT